MQEHVASGFTILPGGFFDFGVASAVDAGNKNHGCGRDLVYIAGIVTGTTDHIRGRESYINDTGTGPMLETASKKIGGGSSTKHQHLV